MTTKFIGMKQLRQNMAKVAKDARTKNERIIVLRRNEPMFELLPLSDSKSLEESFRRDIEEALEDVQAGRVYTQAEVLQKLGL